MVLETGTVCGISRLCKFVSGYDNLLEVKAVKLPIDTLICGEGRK